MAPPATEAERFARARQEFVEAMEAGCTILELRRRKADARAAAKARCGTGAVAHDGERGQDAIRGRQGFVVIDEGADFARWESPWMMRD